jgi:arsenite methyltransferase
MVADIIGTDLYPRRLENLGIRNVNKQDLGWRTWWGGPWLRAILVSCTKPQT